MSKSHELKKEYGLGEKTPSGLILDNIINREGDILPFGLYDPTLEGKLIWMCNYGIEGTEIISLYRMQIDGGDEKDIKYLKDLEEAKYVRDELLKNGWKPLKLPDIKFTFSGKK